MGVHGGAVVRSSPSFARVDVTSAPVPLDAPNCIPSEPTATASRGRPDGLIEIVVTDGVVVRVDAHVDGRALRRVLGALEGR